MKDNIQPIATITNTSGLKGEVRLRPLSRYFDEYLGQRKLMLGFSAKIAKDIKLEIVKGLGKKRRFKFEGVDTLYAAKQILGQTIFVETNKNDSILLIGKELVGFNVITNDGVFVGILNDVLWLPTNDAYLINDGDREVLIPVIPEVVQSIDFDKKLIIIMAMDGLLD
ncbi:MAG: 16S rRNA processing protein RimM [Candidatus Marinimicrobia bacterium]|nr:16S rRNA processing protein RimM [Candidatus Neomarinimicrobiota bacterium]|tara:strand:- start:476 stop:979 length:504 start_codon:yes stop_codon:yes gene_type:complete